jgi:hypothetical protein
MTEKYLIVRNNDSYSLVPTTSYQGDGEVVDVRNITMKESITDVLSEIEIVYGSKAKVVLGV